MRRGGGQERTEIFRPQTRRRHLHTGTGDGGSTRPHVHFPGTRCHTLQASMEDKAPGWQRVRTRHIPTCNLGPDPVYCGLPGATGKTCGSIPCVVMTCPHQISYKVSCAGRRGHFRVSERMPPRQGRTQRCMMHVTFQRGLCSIGREGGAVHVAQGPRPL